MVKSHPKFWLRLQALSLKSKLLSGLLFNFKPLFEREIIVVNLVIIGLALVFLKGPLLGFANSYFSPADMLQGSPVFAVNNASRFPHNNVLGDDIYTYLPWIEFSWRSFRQGILPLWNPYNGAGQPLMANMQSSIFFPSQWPGLFFGERIGLLARCFIHLYLAGLFAYYYFRSLKVWSGAALVGAVAFMFGGMMVVWLYNEVSATFLLFPLLLLVIERHLNRVTSSLRFMAELGLAVMLQIFGGHPETIFLSIGLATVYLVYRIATDNVYSAGRKWKEKIKLLGLYIAGGVWGIILGAVQLFPFVEYLSNSAALVARSNLKPSLLLAPQYLLSFIFPNPFGNPTFGTKLDFTRPNYSEVSSSYIGLSVFFLAVCALWIARRNPLIRFLWLLNLVIIQLVYNIGPLQGLIVGLVPVNVMYTRLMGYAGFFLVTLMVLTLDGLYHNIQQAKTKARMRQQIKRVVVPGGIFLLFLTLGFWWFSNSNLVPFDKIKVSNFEIQNFLIMVGLFVVSLIGLLLLGRNPGLNKYGVIIIGLAIYGQLTFTGSNYRSTVPDALFYPNTSVTSDLQKMGGRIATASSPGLLPAEANIWYDLEQINSYDSLGVRWFDELRQASVSRWPDWNNAVPLNLFNVKQVLAQSSDPSFQSSTAKDCPQLKRASKYPGVNIYNNLAYQPPYRLIYHSVSEPEGQAVKNLVDGKINPLDTTVFIEGETPPDLLNNIPPLIVPMVKVVSKTSNEVNLQVDNPQPGYLYIDQTYFPGWEARVNGETARLYRANVAFTALPVKAGALNIRLTYNPFSFRLGTCLTLLGLMLLSLYANINGLKVRASKQQAPLEKVDE